MTSPRPGAEVHSSTSLLALVSGMMPMYGYVCLRMFMWLDQKQGFANLTVRVVLVALFAMAITSVVPVEHDVRGGAAPLGFIVEWQVCLGTGSDDPENVLHWAAYAPKYQAVIEELWQARVPSMSYQPGQTQTYDIYFVDMVQRRTSCAAGWGSFRPIRRCFVPDQPVPRITQGPIPDTSASSS